MLLTYRFQHENTALNIKGLEVENQKYDGMVGKRISKEGIFERTL